MQISGGTAYETFVGEKCVYFFQPDDCIWFRVSSTFGLSRSVSDKPQTMSGLSSVPNGTSSQTILNRANRNSLASAIENRADANSDIGFARLCFVRHKDGIYAICCLVPQGTHTKVLHIVFRDADMTRGVLQTWKDTDHRRCKHPAG